MGGKGVSEAFKVSVLYETYIFQPQRRLGCLRITDARDIWKCLIFLTKIHLLVVLWYIRIGDVVW